MNHHQSSLTFENKKKLKVLIACEYSGIVREAFKARGHDAWSCDILDTEIPGQHLKKKCVRNPR